MDDRPSCEHEYEPVTIFRPKFCDDCHAFIWGVRRQALECALCARTVHNDRNCLFRCGAALPLPLQRFTKRCLIVLSIMIPLALALNAASFPFVWYMIEELFPDLHMRPFAHQTRYQDLWDAAIVWCVVGSVVSVLGGGLSLYVALLRAPSDPSSCDVRRVGREHQSINAEVEEEEVPHLHFGRRRRRHLVRALVVVELVIIMCVIGVVGPYPWGASGVIFLLHIHSLVVETKEEDGEFSRESVAFLFCNIVAVPLVAGVLFLVAIASLVYIACRIVKFLRNSNGAYLAWAALSFGVVAMVLVIVAIVMAGGIPKNTPHVRALCFRNSCRQEIRVGQIGGSTGIPCAGGCPVGTTCNFGNKLCHFTMPIPKNLFLGPDGQHCAYFKSPPVMAQIYPVTGGIVYTKIQWSGSLYASTGCDSDDDQAACETGICSNCTEYTGPSGPVTQAEMTLLNDDSDFYDVTVINGINVPISITPSSPQGTAFMVLPETNPAYYCRAPGSSKRQGNGLTPKSSWSFEPSDPAKYAWVSNPDDIPCPCSGERVCGTALVLNNGLPTLEVKSNVCGKLLGYWSDDELCTWTDHTGYGDCGKEVPGFPGATLDALFQCNGRFADSCYQQAAGPGCCGCTPWPDLGLTQTMECVSQTAPWVSTVMPRLHFLKKGCPTCYTYPYDDSTSLFTCRSNTTQGNQNSYIIEFCPGGVEVT